MGQLPPRNTQGEGEKGPNNVYLHRFHIAISSHYSTHALLIFFIFIIFVFKTAPKTPSLMCERVRERKLLFNPRETEAECGPPKDEEDDETKKKKRLTMIFRMTDTHTHWGEVPPPQKLGGTTLT